MNIQEIIKAFRQTRIESEQMLEAERITWEQFSSVMLSFEAELRNEGVRL